MPKYYVKSGDIKFIIDKPNPESAIRATLKYYQGTSKVASFRICVSEKGFEDFKNWVCYDMEDFVREIQ